jgi:hypothetical protein
MVGDNRVRINLKVQLTDVDPSQNFAINGERVPSFRSKQVCTGIETGFGQSVVLSGMTETRMETIRRGFGRTEDVENRIGLVVIVTPETADRVGAVPNATRQVAPK